MRDGRIRHRDADNILFGCLDAFANSLWHLASLAHAHTNMALAITYNYHSAEAKASTTFDHLGDAVDLNDALLQFKVIQVMRFCATIPPKELRVTRSDASAVAHFELSIC